MDWKFVPGISRQALINELVSSQETNEIQSKVLAYTVCDDILWSVREFYDKRTKSVKRNIFCTLMESRINDSGYSEGYKTIEEGKHPCCYSCPLEYLNMVPSLSGNEVCLSWREGVRKYHLRQNTKQKQGE